MANKNTAYNFGEKTKEYNAKAGKEVDVWQSPKYKEARQKAIDAIESDRFKGVLSESDFWILMNSMKNGKIAYTGLIISHNGCLKINDALPVEDRFKPSCLTIDKDGYNGSLVYSYSNDAQGIYEVGEVSAKNCTNAYPYAMALKRCMDRVILKSSKLAYSGIYSDSEAEEFKNEPDDSKPTTATKTETPKTETKPEAPQSTSEDKYEIRRELVKLCKDNNLDIRNIAAEFHLNDGSPVEDFAAACYEIQLRLAKGGNL